MSFQHPHPAHHQPPPFTIPEPQYDPLEHNLDIQIIQRALRIGSLVKAIRLTTLIGLTAIVVTTILLICLPFQSNAAAALAIKAIITIDLLIFAFNTTCAIALSTALRNSALKTTINTAALFVGPIHFIVIANLITQANNHIQRVGFALGIPHSIRRPTMLKHRHPKPPQPT